MISVANKPAGKAWWRAIMNWNLPSGALCYPPRPSTNPYPVPWRRGLAGRDPPRARSLPRRHTSKPLYIPPDGPLSMLSRTPPLTGRTDRQTSRLVFSNSPRARPSIAATPALSQLDRSRKSSGVKLRGAANEPSKDKHDGGESETLQPRENNVDDRTIPVIERQQSAPLRQRPAIADRRDALVQVQYVPMVAL